MKRYSKTRALLGIGLFLVELLVFVCTAWLLKMEVKDIVLFSAVYFLLLLFFNHFNFLSVLIWYEVVELLKMHALYWAVSFAVGVYLGGTMLLQGAIHVLIMFFASITVERIFRLASRNHSGIRVLVVGAGETAEKMHILFNRNRFLYINPVAYVSLTTVTGSEDSELIASTATIISPDEMIAFAAAHAIDELYIADDQLTAEKLDEITGCLRNTIPVIRYKPEMKVFQPYNTDITDYDETLFTTITDIRRSRIALAIRKVLDVLAGLAGCLLLIPVTIFVKIGYLRSGDKSPIMFTQDRIGKDGKLVKIYKYRTMVPNAEQLLEEMMANDPKIREEYLTNKKLNPDPRVTPFGDLLRRTSLDELPQFLNILKGDMSLIGPRPYLPREKEDMGSQYDAIIKFKPGLTGIWQASGRNDISFSERCKLDEYYYYNWSIWLDVIIFVKTIKAVFLRDGAI